jgi:heme-degrading monooxygenase HmoA
MAMVIVVFRSRFKEGVDLDAYRSLVLEMHELVGTRPGFLSIENFDGPDGGQVALVCFETADAAAAWRDHPAHREAQRRGREEFFSWYSVHVADVIRSHELQLTTTAPSTR